MTSNSSSLQDSTRQQHESSSTPPTERYAIIGSTSKPHSSGPDISEMGEPSVSANQRQSAMASGLATGGDGASDGRETLPNEKPVKEGRGSHRSHKSRASGGFLLNAAFDRPPGDANILTTAESPSRIRRSTPNSKGKSPLLSPEKKTSKRRSLLGDHTGSPRTVDKSPGKDAGRAAEAERSTNGTQGQNGTSAEAASSALDVDSAQIVNLAITLSESRKNASRRVVSLPPVSSGVGESFAGGSLRQHLQQQRRISRTVSPKPDRGDRAITASPRVTSGQSFNSPLRSAFEGYAEGQYQYHFSASTLARAEKARETIELLAEYRRLLEYVPPLKPDAISRSTTTASTSIPSEAVMNPGNLVSGRAYNPLQYIRNRKLRARHSRAIDGEAQGFGDVERVSAWVNQVATSASSRSSESDDAPSFPSFSPEAEYGAASPQSSPQTLARNPTSSRVKRPRIDWMITPADLLADTFWLEQDDNKRLIEDHHGKRIFPPKDVLTRPATRKSEESQLKQTPSPVVKKGDIEADLCIDTQFPEFKSAKSDNEIFSDSTTSDARQQLRDVRGSAKGHGHSNSIRDSKYFMRVGRSRSRSNSSSSGSDSLRRPRRRRSGTTDSHDHGTDILERQMREMLAKEAKEMERYSSSNPESQTPMESIKPMPVFERTQQRSQRPKGVNGHSRSTSLIDQKDSPGRPSLEVPGASPRRSLEGYISTTPNSPQNYAQQLSNAGIPAVGIGFSSQSRSRPSSPTRRGLSKVKSKIRPLYERNHDSVVSSAKEKTPEISEEPEKRRRSLSPVKVGRTSEDSKRPLNAGSFRKAKPEDVSGIRGLFKGSRNPVTKVGDMIFRKDSNAGGSGFSTDESDAEDKTRNDDKTSRESSASINAEDGKGMIPEKVTPSFIQSMPIFSSPFERRGRRREMTPAELEEDFQQQQMKGFRGLNIRGKSKWTLVEGAPEIKLQDASPASSPESRREDCLRRDSSTSNDSRRVSPHVLNADARLNAILGAPGKRRNALPMTGLANLDTNRGSRPSLQGKRQWSISDRGVSVVRGPMNELEISRVQALLLSSGTKAAEIYRRATEATDIATDENALYTDVALLAQTPIPKVPKNQKHKLAGRILSDDIQLSAHLWQSSADSFVDTTITALVEQMSTLQTRLQETLTPATRSAGDEADDVQRDLVTSHTLEIKTVMDMVSDVHRGRKRKGRWAKRGVWVLLEYALLGVMWWVWAIVGTFNRVSRTWGWLWAFFRWLFWMS